MMRNLAREVCLLALVAALSWWFFLGWRSDPPDQPGRTSSGPLSLALTPMLEAMQDTESEDNEAASGSQQESDTERPVSARGPAEQESERVDSNEASSPERAPAESGSPGGAKDEDPSLLGDHEKPSLQDLMGSPDLLASAEAELGSTERRGFSTQLLASPDDQLVIARFFAEEVLLVPRAAMDPDNRNPVYFRLNLDDGDTVEACRGSPPLDRYRQYRDLFDYEYARLPEPVRALRRAVLSRSEVYLFAALIPIHEWATVIARRRAALESLGRQESELKSIQLRYAVEKDHEPDLHVTRMVFSDGQRIDFSNPARRD